MSEILGNKYNKHKVFGQLKVYAEFYRDLSFSVMRWVTKGTVAVPNIDTYVYSSIQGTIESIHDILLKGRINDSYALLRKYYDSTIINIYSNLYLAENCLLENLIVSQIDDWRTGRATLPEYRIMSQHIREAALLKPITLLIQKDGTFRNIRDRCNDHTHYNYYHNLLLNDSEIFLENRSATLDVFSKDLEDIFIQHLTYVFYLNDHYMMSSDYSDSLESGLTPQDGSQYEVATFIQDIFDKVITLHRPDLASAILRNTAMKLK